MTKAYIQKDYVKKNTMLLVSGICLAVGFLGGIALSVYKSGSALTIPSSMTQQQPVTNKGPSAEETGQILVLEKEISSNPNNNQAWIQLGNLYFDTQQYIKAIHAYETSLSLDPNNADVQTDLGVMFRRNGQPEKAIDAFNRAIQINPRHEISRFNKGIVLMHDLNDTQGAVQVWEELVKMNPQAKAPNGLLVSEMVLKLKQNIK